MKRRERSTRRAVPVRIGIHTSIAGRLERAAERAHELDCDAFQIFSASPRNWSNPSVDRVEAENFRQRRSALGLDPLVIHDNYLINLASTDRVTRTRSLRAFRGELQRAQTLGADYLVMHPGNAVDQQKQQALANVAAGLREGARGLKLNGLQILLENTAGQGSALGAKLEELAELKAAVPELNLGFCLDTAHLFAAGYDIRTPEGLEETLARIERTLGLDNVKVIHTNDSKVGLGGHADRHEHIGRGKIGSEAFQRLLQHPALRGKTFILETPVDKPGDDRRNLQTVRRLAAARN